MRLTLTNLFCHTLPCSLTYLEGSHPSIFSSVCLQTWGFPNWHTVRVLILALLLTNCMCSQQDEGQESLEEELDVLVLDDEGDQVSYSPMVCPPVTPKMVLKKEASVCLLFPIMLT